MALDPVAARAALDVFARIIGRSEFDPVRAADAREGLLLVELGA